jgi:D-serine deaminase-like pyridoxal phosphate-dependent protein
VFIAYPVWAAGRARRLRVLADRVRLRVGVDSADGARLLGTALRGTGASVLVELDAGHHRSGVAPGEATLLERSWRIGGEHLSESVLAGHYLGSAGR